MIAIGIDPGTSGGIAAVEYCNGHGSVRGMTPFSTERYLEILHDCKAQQREDVYAVVEDVHAMPGQGVTSMFSFGRNKGIIEGMLLACGIDYKLVPPQTWKRHFGLRLPHGTDKRTIKNASIQKAKELFPGVSLLATKRCVKPHDGMAEALLMAEYCSYINGGQANDYR